MGGDDTHARQILQIADKRIAHQRAFGYQLLGQGVAGVIAASHGFADEDPHYVCPLPKGTRGEGAVWNLYRSST